MKRCTRCMLPEVFPNIIFDDNGVCSVCHEWDSKHKQIDYEEKERQFTQVLQGLKKGAGGHDCIVAFSGGKDSCYAVYLLREYGANPLAVNFNNLFQTDFARRSISAIVDRVAVDLVTYAPDRENYLRFTRESFLRTGNSCIPCNLGIYSLCQRVATERSIGAVFFGGGSRLEANRISSHPELDYYDYARTVLKGECLVDWRDFEIDAEACATVDPISVGDYFKWEYEEILKVLKTEFDIDFPPSGLQYVHADCRLAPVQNFIHCRQRGFSKKEVTLANMVRDGQLGTEEAVQIINDERESLSQAPVYLDEFLRVLDIGRGIFDKRLEQGSSYRPPWYHGEENPLR